MGQTFGFINNEFINLYSKENPILEKDDSCFFLFSNDIDYHRPLIGRGVIVEDKFTDGMSKVYFIKLVEILESPKTINDFIYGKQFTIFPISEVLHNKKLIQVTANFEFNKISFKIDAFFVRKTIELITELRKEYISILRKDILKQLKDIEEI
jgi:hypothetical protein